MSETNLTALREALCAQQKLLQKLYNELDVERESSATAASEALSMILRLQGEKAAVKMEAEQYKRLAEEKMCHAEESLAIFEDLMYQKEMEVAALDYQVQSYRYKLLSMGGIDPGVGEIKFPENLLQRNENLVGDTSVHSIGRRNSAPTIQLKFLNFKKGLIERERSVSPEIVEELTREELNQQCVDFAVDDINTYWEQIRKLDEQVKVIAGEHYTNLRGKSTSSLFSQDTTKGTIMNELDQIKDLEDSLENEINMDSVGTSSVQDVFEVPQTPENLKSCVKQIKHEEKMDSAKYETEWVKKKLMSSTHREDKLCRPSNSVIVDCHLARGKVSQVNRISEIVEVEGEVVREDPTDKGEEELRLLNEIQQQLKSIQFEIKSLKTKESSPPPQDDTDMVSLMEAMLHFWL